MAQGSWYAGVTKQPPAQANYSTYRQPNNQLPNALNFLSGQAGYNWGNGTSAQGRADQSSLANQINYQAGLGANGSKWLNTNYGTDSALHGLDVQGNQLDMSAAQRPFAPGGTLETQQTGINASRALLARDLASQMRGFALTDTGNYNAAATGARQASSDATARGATVSNGLRAQNTDIYKGLSNQLGQTNVGRENARVQNEQSIYGRYGLNNQQANLNEDKASAGDRVKQLNLNAQKLGINGTQLKNQLQQGLEKLHIDQFANVNDIMDKMNSSSAQDRQLGIQLYNQALDYGGYFPK